ncbi:MAG: hypothetical protein ACLTDC_13300 [Lachnospiraceae bacterium]
MRTNTFAVNSMFFRQMKLRGSVKSSLGRVVLSGCIWHSGRDVWIAADMGPIDENETKSAADVENEYIHLADCFLGLGAKIFAGLRRVSRAPQCEKGQLLIAKRVSGRIHCDAVQF